jgi:hypothetical protein
VSPASANLIAATQGTIRGASFDEKVSAAAWETKPSWAIVTEQDHVIDPNLLRDMAKKIGAKVTSLPSGHVPMVSMAPELGT